MENHSYPADTGSHFPYGALPYNPTLSLWLSVDPLSDKYPGVSPYVYCGNNPVRLVDPDGREGTIPPWILGPAIAVVKGVALLVENFSNSHDAKTVAYAVNHPINAFKTGEAIDGGRNLSSIANNFAVNIQRGIGLAGGNKGDERNAIRHVLWQAILTVQIGEEQAIRIGNAHEDGAAPNPNQRYFDNLTDADRTIDFLNNKIGRDIGKNNPQANHKTLAKKTVEKFYTSGLWTASKCGSGWVIQQKRLTKEQYDAAIKIINRKNEYGLDS